MTLFLIILFSLLFAGFIFYLDKRKLSAKAEVRAKVSIGPPSFEDEIARIESGEDPALKTLNKLNEFDQRHDPNFNIKRTFEDRVKEIKEIAELRFKGVILEDQAERMREQGYVLIENTPSDSRHKQFVVSKTPIQALGGQLLIRDLSHREVDKLIENWDQPTLEELGDNKQMTPNQRYQNVLKYSRVQQ